MLERVSRAVLLREVFRDFNLEKKYNDNLMALNIFTAKFLSSKTQIPFLETSVPFSRRVTRLEVLPKRFMLVLWKFTEQSSMPIAKGYKMLKTF